MPANCQHAGLSGCREVGGTALVHPACRAKASFVVGDAASRGVRTRRCGVPVSVGHSQGAVSQRGAAAPSSRGACSHLQWCAGLWTYRKTAVEAELDEQALRTWNAAFPDRFFLPFPTCLLAAFARFGFRVSSPGASPRAALGRHPHRAHRHRQANGGAAHDGMHAPAFASAARRTAIYIRKKPLVKKQIKQARKRSTLTLSGGGFSQSCLSPGDGSGSNAVARDRPRIAACMSTCREYRNRSLKEEILRLVALQTFTKIGIAAARQASR